MCKGRSPIEPVELECISGVARAESSPLELREIRHERREKLWRNQTTTNRTTKKPTSAHSFHRRPATRSSSVETSPKPPSPTRSSRRRNGARHQEQVLGHPTDVQ